MERIVEIFKKKDQINSFEEKVLWREELLYLIEREKSSDVLLEEIADILNTLISKKERKGLEISLFKNFDLFLKYLNISKEVWQTKILDLIDLSEEYLGDKHKFSEFHRDFFCSYKLSAWAKELYYLIGKIEKKDDFIQSTLRLLKKARGIITKEDKFKLEENLKMFKVVKHKYFDINK